MTPAGEVRAKLTAGLVIPVGSATVAAHFPMELLGRGGGCRRPRSRPQDGKLEVKDAETLDLCCTSLAVELTPAI